MAFSKNGGREVNQLAVKGLCGPSTAVYNGLNIQNRKSTHRFGVAMRNFASHKANLSVFDPKDGLLPCDYLARSSSIDVADMLIFELALADLNVLGGSSLALSQTISQSCSQAGRVTSMSFSVP